MKFLLQTLLSIFFFGCVNQAETLEESIDRREYIEERNAVHIMVLAKDTFKKELVSNGKLKALRRSELSFNLNEPIESLSVKNGSMIQKGEIIAKLRQVEQRQNLEKAKMNLKKARLDLEDLLIGQGYDLHDSTSIPQNLLEIAKIRSGYVEALQNLKEAQYAYQSTVLVAPFSGKIANLQAKLYERPTVGEGEAFCTLIDDAQFEVDFQVTEAEMQEVHLDQIVKVIPFSTENSYSGRISEINPVVDENGLVSVKALLKNPGELVEGMNVKVLVETEVPGQLIVPKEAVVLRQNQEVLFKYEAGEAFWTYVKINFENSDSYAVIAHPDKEGTLANGDTIIISGNLNLAHRSSVEIDGE